MTKISVLMGIYNCAPTLSAAIDSLLSQTEQDWELILCDDGSSDDTFAIAEAYRQQYPSRILLLQNERNMGLNYTLNRCLSHAGGKYIARMDGDDLSLPTRFAEEAAFLDSHPEISIVSCPMEYFDQTGIWGRGWAIPQPAPMDFLSGTPFCHAPCMVRAEAIRAVGGYSTDPRTIRAEDYDLWFRMYAAGYRGCNLPDPLYRMRDDRDALSRRKFRFCLHEAYVRFRGFRLLKLPLWTRVYALRPILVGLLPRPLYRYLHRKKLSRKD